MEAWVEGRSCSSLFLCDRTLDRTRCHAHLVSGREGAKAVRAWLDSGLVAGPDAVMKRPILVTWCAGVRRNWLDSVVCPITRRRRVWLLKHSLEPYWKWSNPTWAMSRHWKGAFGHLMETTVEVVIWLGLGTSDHVQASSVQHKHTWWACRLFRSNYWGQTLWTRGWFQVSGLGLTGLDVTGQCVWSVLRGLMASYVVWLLFKGVG
jgi:hypothetical protein